MILVVDDHRDTRDVLLRLLHADGYHALGLADGHEALVFLATHTPNLVFLDYSMPGLDGLHVFRHMKRDPRLAPIPVIMFSANDGLWKEKAIAEGVDAYIVKGALDWGLLQREVLRLAGPGTLPIAKPLPPTDLTQRTA